jgi:hypothetical protein
MAKRERSTSQTAPQHVAPPDNIAAAIILGALIGALVGLSNSPVVTTVVATLVGLLAGIFGLSDKSNLALSETGARRLSAFAMGVLMLLPIAIIIRTHDMLGPSVERQKMLLTEIGILDNAERKDVLKYLRFGLLPSGSAPPAKDGYNPLMGTRGVLYNIPATDCDRLTRLLDNTDDVVAALRSGSTEMRELLRHIDVETSPADRAVATRMGVRLACEAKK